MKKYTQKPVFIKRIAVIFPVLFLLFLGVNLVSSKVFAQSDNITSGAHLITIYDRGEQQVEVTDASTIAEALKNAGIEIDKSDRVEPALSEKLVAKEYSINIYRARPVLVVDGNTKQKVITAYQTALQIAKDAGIKLFSEDIATLSRTDNIISDGAGLKLEIKRATDVNFDLYGKSSDVKTQANTIADFLKEKNITLSNDDKVLPVESTKILPGMQIRLWREGIQTVNVEEPINFDVREIQDGDREIGYKEVKTSGVVGSKTVTYEILIQNGKEVSRKEIANIVTKQPTEQIEVVGAKYRGAYTTPSQNESITWNFLIANGFSRNQTAGIMGNLMQEHRFNTTGDGLAQWIGGRKAALLSRPDPYNIYTQLDFMMYELNGGYSRAKNAILNSSTVEQAVVAFQNKYEGCGICMENNRIQYAYNILASH